MKHRISMLWPDGLKKAVTFSYDDGVMQDLRLTALFRRVVESGERSILFSTHITSDLEKCATHITLLHEGAVRCSDTRAGFLARYRAHGATLEDVFVSLERRDYDDADLL